MDSILSIALVVAREGFESILLTVMILRYLPDRMHWQYYLCFYLYWFISLSAGIFSVYLFNDVLQSVQPFLSVGSGLMLIYLATCTKSIYSHAQINASKLDCGNFWRIHNTMAAIIFREAAEGTAFLTTQANTSILYTLSGISIGLVIMTSLFLLADILGRAVTNRIIFQIIGLGLLLTGVYYIIDGISDLYRNIGHM